VESQVCADLGSRTSIGTSGNLIKVAGCWPTKAKLKLCVSVEVPSRVQKIKVCKELARKCLTRIRIMEAFPAKFLRSKNLKDDIKMDDYKLTNL
jgi:hypothetical protein